MSLIKEDLKFREEGDKVISESVLIEEFSHDDIVNFYEHNLMQKYQAIISDTMKLRMRLDELEQNQQRLSKMMDDWKERYNESKLKVAIKSKEKERGKQE